MRLLYLICVLLPVFYDTNLLADSSRCVRIVSLAPSITEVVYEIGLGGNVVGVTRFCRFPEEAKEKVSVGGVLDRSYEALIGLNPSLVIHLASDNEAAHRLSTLKLRTLAVNHSTVEGILDSLRKIGRECEVEGSAEEIAKRLRDKIAHISAAVRGRPLVRALVSVGRTETGSALKSVFISGNDGYFSDVLKLAGAENVYQGKTISAPSLSAEGIISLAPEVILEFVTDLEDRSMLAQEIKKSWEVIPVEAVKNRRIYVFNSDYAVIPGPRFVMLLEDLVKVLHG